MEELIAVRQLPIVEERLQALKAVWDQHAADAEAIACTDETVKAVKALRADMRKDFEEVDALRKAVKKAVLEPYEKLEARFNECITEPYMIAYAAYSRKITEVESEQKRRCEESLRDYFAELCAVRHLGWLAYERAGIKVDMASAKAKTPKRLREQLATFVAQVGDSVDRIVELDDAEEIMVEFRQTLDAAGAICAVQERHRRIEDEHIAQEARKAAQEQEATMIRRVEALSPPVVVEVPKTAKCTFTVHTTVGKLKKLKEFLNMEGIQYESTPEHCRDCGI